jgi:outer membrane cobalamin receptor
MRHRTVAVLAALAAAPRFAYSQTVQDRTATITAIVLGGDGRLIPGVTVRLDDDRRLKTDSNGEARFSFVDPGRHRLSARSLGYLESTKVVTVSDREFQPDTLRLVRTPTLDQIIVTGTRMPIDRLETVAPVTSFTAQQIDDQQIGDVYQLMRGTFPGVVAFGGGGFSNLTTISFRGTSSLLAPTTETLINGVPVAIAALAQPDKYSLDSVVALRGPEGTTAYGVEGTGGVIQYFTKTGDTVAAPPAVDLRADGGIVQPPNSGRVAAAEDYAASVHGGLPWAGYDVGGSLEEEGPWIPAYFTHQENAYAGFLIHAAGLRITGFGRYYEDETPLLYPPALVATGLPQFAPLNLVSVDREHTIGAHFQYAPASWNAQDLIIGTDGGRYSYHRPSASDSSLSYVDRETRTSIFYTTRFTARPTPHVLLATDAGVDYSAGPSQSQIPGSSSGMTIWSSETGYLFRETLLLGDWLVIKGGVRAEQFSTFPAHTGTPLLPYGGAKYTVSVGDIRVGTRLEYGDAIRPPYATETVGDSTGPGTVRPNASLRSERQVGGDGGVDVDFGKVASIGVTYYRQMATNLIELDPVLPFVQYQNVGNVLNDGLELEGKVTTPRVSANAQFSIMHGAFVHVDPGYDGAYRVGDAPLYAPQATAGAAITVRPTRRTTLTAGMTYVARYRGQNDRAAADSIDTDPIRAPSLASRVFWEWYPGYVTARFDVAQQVTPWISLYAVVEDIANAHQDEVTQIVTSPGREARFGVRVRTPNR